MARSPIATTSLVPTRTASRVPTTEPTATDSATGSRCTPVDNGLKPWRNWKYWVTRKMKPNSVKKATVTDPLAAVKRMLRKSFTSSMGVSTLRAHAMNSEHTTVATTKPATLRPLDQPTSGASIMVKTTDAMAAVDRANPGRSRRAIAGSLELGTLKATNRAPTAATGTMKTKMLIHENCPSRKPPTMGPTAMATPALAPHSPIDTARSRRSVNTLAMIDKVAGKIMAAPIPITARAAMSADGVVVTAPARLASPNTARPPSSIPLRPKRSDRLPEVRSNAAKTRL